MNFRILLNLDAIYFILFLFFLKNFYIFFSDAAVAELLSALTTSMAARRYKGASTPPLPNNPSPTPSLNATPPISITDNPTASLLPNSSKTSTPGPLFDSTDTVDSTGVNADPNSSKSNPSKASSLATTPVKASANSSEKDLPPPYQSVTSGTKVRVYKNIDLKN